METVYGIVLNETELNKLRDALETALNGKPTDDTVLMSWEELPRAVRPREKEFLVTIDANAYRLVESLNFGDAAEKQWARFDDDPLEA